MNEVTINGDGFSFSARFEYLSAAIAQAIAFEAMSKLVEADQLLRAQVAAKFDVVLRSYAEGRKIHMIKEIRAVAGIDLKAAKDLSEALPAAVVEKVGAKEAATIAKNFELAGGSVEIRPAA